MGERHVVVGVDGSAASRTAVRWAAGLAETFGAEVVAVHAVGLIEDQQAHEVAGRDRLADLREQVETAWCDELTRAPCPHRVELRDGPALDVLARVAGEERADVLVVGSRGTGGNAALALGSTSLGVLQIARVAVLVVPAADAGPGVSGASGKLRLGRILVGVDRSPPSLAALELAADLAGATQGTLSVLEVVEFVPPFPLGPPTAPADEETRRTRVQLEAAVKDIRQRGVPVQVVVRSGEPAPTLLELAEGLDVDLVVVGTRGRGGPAAPLLGSVARTVADRVRRPTLVVPAAAGQVRLRPAPGA